jgi:hypothetical protein
LAKLKEFKANIIFVPMPPEMRDSAYRDYASVVIAGVEHRNKQMTEKARTEGDVQGPILSRQEPKSLSKTPLSDLTTIPE